MSEPKFVKNSLIFFVFPIIQYFYCVIFLSDNLSFPALNNTDESGILAIGGDLSIERLKLAYRNGIFPWYSDGDPIVWYSPDPRMVLLPQDLRVSKSMRQLINSKKYKVTFNTAFESVISNCKSIDRSRQGEQSTWITSEMKEAYIALYRCGAAKSVEVWEGNELVGGLYGVEVGKVFCGESMFSKVSNASKLAFITLVRQKKYVLIDCQVYNPHLSTLGAKEVKRDDFLKFLNQ